MKKKRVLLISPKNAAGTGSGTYSGILAEALERIESLKVRRYASVSDLSESWDVAHVMDLKHLDPQVAQSVKAPLVIDLHDVYWLRGEQLFPSVDLPLRLFFAARRRGRYEPILKRANAVIVHSAYVGSRTPHPNVRVIPYAVEPLEPGPPLAERPPRVIFAGRDYFRKGLPVLLSAWRRVSALRPDAKLLIAGREFVHGRAYAKSASLKRSVKWLGDVARDDLLDEIRRARALVLPSWTEAFGIVLIEAAAMGTPAVATRVGGIPEALAGGSRGILVEKGDPVALAASILRCLDLEPDRKLIEITKRAQQAASEYSVSNLVSAVSKVYEEVSGRP